MADDIIIQLKSLAETLERGAGQSTIYGAIQVIEFLRDEIDIINTRNHIILDEIVDLRTAGNILAAELDSCANENDTLANSAISQWERLNRIINDQS